MANVSHAMLAAARTKAATPRPAPLWSANRPWMKRGQLRNAPVVQLGAVVGSRDCFFVQDAVDALAALEFECRKLGVNILVCPIVVENHNDKLAALEWARAHNINALIAYDGNFGPEGPMGQLVEEFDRHIGVVMVAGCAEESVAQFRASRKDTFCGALSQVFGLELLATVKTRYHLPEKPVDVPAGTAKAIQHFKKLAQMELAARDLVVITAGPCPEDFRTCFINPRDVQQQGIELSMQAESDLLADFQAMPDDDPEVKATVRDMRRELGPAGNTYPDLLVRLARYEVTLKRFIEKHRHGRKYVVLAIKCWPAFEKLFECVPCYVNARMASQGIPVACEVDVWGAISLYMSYLASERPPVLVDINNNIPADMVANLGLAYILDDLMAVFHCGNCSSECMCFFKIAFQAIMYRLMEPDSAPKITRGTLEGRHKPGPVTIFRLQGNFSGDTDAFLASGEVLNIEVPTFGAVSMVAVKNWGRYYRHALLGRHPHHAVLVFGQVGRIMWDWIQMRKSTREIFFPREPGDRYPGECPASLD